VHPDPVPYGLPVTASFTVSGGVTVNGPFTVTDALAWLPGSLVVVAAGVVLLAISETSIVRFEALPTEADEQL